MGKNMVIVTSILLVMACMVILSSCSSNSESEADPYNVPLDVGFYKDGPAWKLALAVRDEDTETIEKLAKSEPKLLNYQDPKYGATLLLWAVGMEKYKSAESLLKCGADPNIALKTDGTTPLFLAAGFSWIDSDAKKDAKYVRLLLDHGADPNKCFKGRDKSYVTEPGTSPLMESIGCGIEKTKALVEAGADINYRTPTRRTAAIRALLAGWNTNSRGMAYARYLIVEKRAKVSEYYHMIAVMSHDDPKKKLFPVDILRRWDYPKGSEEYRTKMEIVNEFARQGVNYDVDSNNSTRGQN